MNANLVFSDDDQQCNNENCIAEIEQLTSEIRNCEKAYKETIVKYQLLLAENLKKDVLIENLHQKLIDERFNEFADHFDERKLENFRKIAYSKREDPSFVLAAVQSLYADNLAVLKFKSVSGKSKNDSKTAVTPLKRKILTELFEKRMELVSAKEAINVQRKAALNKHIKAAIVTVNKQLS